MKEDNQTSTASNYKEGTKNIALLAQISVFSAFIFGIGAILGPIIVKLANENKYPELNDFFNELINFQLSIFIYALICIPLCFILIGIPLLFTVSIFWLVYTLLGLSKVCNYDYNYKYPMTIRMIK